MRNNGVDAERFIDFYTSNGWKIGGKSKMKDWEAAVRTWESRHREDAASVKAKDTPTPVRNVTGVRRKF
jgi:hypothetical protein